MNKEKEIKKDKKFIEKRLRSSNKKRWNTLTSEEREAVVNKYYDLRSIERLGIDKILDDNRNLRSNFVFLVIGVVLGVFGNVLASIWMQYLPKDLLHEIIMVVVIVIFLVWGVPRLGDILSADHLRQDDVLEHLLRLVKKGHEAETLNERGRLQ